MFVFNHFLVNTILFVVVAQVFFEKIFRKFFKEQVCREPVAAGVPCFGPFLTIQRFHFNQNKGQCEAFQYYGCGGTGNNFITRSQCEMQCVPSVQNSKGSSLKINKNAKCHFA